MPGPKVTLISILILLFLYNIHGELDFEDIIGFNSTDENTVLRKVLQHVSLMSLEMKEMKLELKECVKKDELNEFSFPDSMQQRTAGSVSPAFTNNQYRMLNISTSTEAPVVPATNMSTMDQILKLLVHRSCHEWLESGFTLSGTYNIDPDGQGIGDPPFPVHCDMLTGFTFVRHDLEGQRQASSCRGPGCYKERLNYETSEKQIQSLITLSQSCQQFLKVDCIESPFQKEDVPLAWWKGRDGLQHYEWAGEDYPDHTCACGSLASCVNPMESCNCNANIRNVWVSDSGYVTNRSALPVQEVAFGTQDQYTPLQIKYSIGPLRCFGSRSLSYPTSCLDIFLRGSVRSGWYILGNPQSLRFTFCDMDNLHESYTETNSMQDDQVEPVRSLDVDLENLILRNLESKGFSILKKEEVDSMDKKINDTMKSLLQKMAEQDSNLTRVENLVKHNDNRLVDHSLYLETFKSNLMDLYKVVTAPSINVAFHADTHVNWPNNGIVRYEVVSVNQGNGYNAQTGKFTAPVAGVYYIAAYGRQNTSSRTYFWIKKNGNKINLGDNQAGRFTTLGTAALVDLKVGDEVYVDMVGNWLGHTDKGVSFMGFLIYEI